MTPIIRRFAALSLAAFLFNPASAQSLIEFDFSGVSGTTIHDPDTFELTATSTIAADLNLILGLNAFNPSVIGFAGGGGSATNDMNVNGWGTATGTSISAPIGGHRYVSFTLQAADGFQLDLSGATIEFDIRRNGGNAPKRFAVAANLDGGGFATSDQIGVNTDDTGTAANTVSGTFEAGFDGITDPVQIAFMGWNANISTGNLHITGARITGGQVTAIPEPATWMTSLVAVFALMLFRRQRR